MDDDYALRLLLPGHHRPKYCFLHDRRVADLTGKVCTWKSCDECLSDRNGNNDYGSQKLDRKCCNTVTCMFSSSPKVMVIASKLQIKPGEYRSNSLPLNLVKKQKKPVIFADDHGELLTRKNEKNDDSCRQIRNKGHDKTAQFLRSSNAMLISSHLPETTGEFRDRSNSLPSNLKKKQKKLVTFADDHGELLTTVHTFQNTSFEKFKMKLKSDFQKDFRDDFQKNFRNDIQRDLKNNNFRKDFRKSSREKSSDVTIRHNLKNNRCNYHQKVHRQQVALENVYVQGTNKLCGKVGVATRALHKEVYVRYTIDNWDSHDDVTADYLGQDDDDYVEPNANRPQIDTFFFTIPVDTNSYSASEHLSIHFAVCFRSDGAECWDNNDSQNFQVSLRKSE